MNEVPLTMTKQERTKLYTIKLLIDGRTCVKDAAQALALSERQVKRLKKGVSEYGDALNSAQIKGQKECTCYPR